MEIINTVVPDNEHQVLSNEIINTIVGPMHIGIVPSWTKNGLQYLRPYIFHPGSGLTPRLGYLISAQPFATRPFADSLPTQDPGLHRTLAIETP